MFKRSIFVATFGLVSNCVWWLPGATVSAAMEWSGAQALNTNAESDGNEGDYYVNWAQDGNGNWVAVWCAAVAASQDRDFDIMVSRSADNGITWTTPTELDPYAVYPPEIDDDFHPFVVTDSSGNWVASWYTHDDHGGTIGASDTDLLVSVSTNGGVTWTSSVPLNADATSDTRGDSSVSMDTDGNGLWVAVWTKYGSSPADDDIYTAQSVDNGHSWSAPSLLHASLATDAGDDFSASIVTDRAGHWMVVWNSTNVIDSNGMINTTGIDDDIFVATSTDGISWTAPAALNSNAADPDGQDDRRPRIAYDGTGRWVATWHHGLYDIDYDVRFSYSDDHGVTWSQAAYLNDYALTDGGRDQYPVPATDGNGNWVVVWQSRDPVIPPVGTDFDILYSVSTDNAQSWSAPWFLNAHAPETTDLVYDRDPEILYAGNGAWRTAWGSQFNIAGLIGGDYDILMSTACLPLIAGDHDCDGDIDLADYTAFAECMSGPGEGGSFVEPAAACLEAFDFPSADGDIDLNDFAAFQEALGGSGG